MRTVISPSPKPTALPSSAAPGFQGLSSTAVLIASTTAVEVTVATERASTSVPRVRGMVFPTKRPVKSSPSQFCPIPTVWVEAST